jgi:antibiotic biosynthesis monooxygenase (ABM) superfamily enzyme
MAYSFRYEYPQKAGCLVKENIRCGHENCYCIERKRFHEGWYLYYRDYPTGGKLKKKYVAKNRIWEYIMLIYLAKYNDLKHRMNAHDRRIVLERIEDAMGYYRQRYESETLQVL